MKITVSHLAKVISLAPESQGDELLLAEIRRGLTEQEIQWHQTGEQLNVALAPKTSL